MPSLKKYAPHGLAAGKTPADTVDAVQSGDLVVPPFGGPAAGLPPIFDPMALTIFRDDFYRLEEDGTDVGGWAQNDIGNGLSAGPALGTIEYAPGVVTITTASVATGDGSHFQWDVEWAALATTRPCWFAARIYYTLYKSDVHVRIGIGEDTANPFSSDPKGIYFVIGESVDGTVGTIVKDASGTTETAATGSSVEVNTWHEIAWRYDKSSVRFYLDRTLIDTVTTNIPTGEELAPFFAAITHTGDSAKALSLDYIQLVTTRHDNV